MIGIRFITAEDHVQFDHYCYHSD